LDSKNWRVSLVHSATAKEVFKKNLGLLPFLAFWLSGAVLELNLAFQAYFDARLFIEPIE